MYYCRYVQDTNFSFSLHNTNNLTNKEVCQELIINYITKFIIFIREIKNTLLNTEMVVSARYFAKKNR